jgi:hypothetical protein
MGGWEVLSLEGVSRVREHAFLHKATRTFVVAALVLNFGAR